MARTSPAAVEKLLGADYGLNPNGSRPDLQQFIDTASVIVDRVASGTGGILAVTPTSAELELVERWLAAHCYALSDQPYASRSTQGASGSFQGKTDMNFEATKYGQMATRIDPTGMLNAIGKRNVAGIGWLGKTKSEQIDYEDRS